MRVFPSSEGTRLVAEAATDFQGASTRNDRGRRYPGDAEALGYQVMVAHTSQQGIETARKLEPHIVLCDIGLPDSDGYVVGSVLRQSGHSTAALLIAVTGRTRASWAAARAK